MRAGRGYVRRGYVEREYVGRGYVGREYVTCGAGICGAGLCGAGICGVGICGAGRWGGAMWGGNMRAGLCRLERDSLLGRAPQEHCESGVVGVLYGRGGAMQGEENLRKAESVDSLPSKFNIECYSQVRYAMLGWGMSG